MRLDRLTNKTREALMAAQGEASRRGNPELQPEHLLSALLEQEGGIAQPILQKAGVDAKQLTADVARELSSFPRVQGGAEPGLGRRMRDVMTRAWKETEDLKDEYTSAEHILLALIEQRGDNLTKALERGGLTRDKLLESLRAVRGSTRIDDPDPEGKFQALEKYTRDLTAAARQGKIDPVIGRDEEIRRVMQVLSRRTKKTPC